MMGVSRKLSNIEQDRGRAYIGRTVHRSFVTDVDE